VSSGAVSRRPVTSLPEARSAASRGLLRRLRGVDAARAIAVLGMVMVHFGPNPRPDTLLGDLYGVSHGRASVLFALLAGVGVALLVDGRLRGQGKTRRPTFLARGRLIFRGALLLPLGLWLQQLDHGAYVILQYYAVYFLFAALVLTLPDRWLLVGGVAVLVGGPLVYLWGTMLASAWYTGDPASLDDPAGKIFRDLLLAGKYPLVTWAAPLLVGLWIGRRNLAAPALRWWLLLLGLAVAVAAALASDWLTMTLGGPFEGRRDPSFAVLLTDTPHNQMPLWMLGSIGSACAVLGGMLLLADQLPRSTWPLVATGQLALTVYVGHLLLLDAFPELLKRDTVPEAFLTVGIFMLLAVAASTLWRAFLPRGPLEAAVAAPWWIVERLVQPVVRRLTADRHYPHERHDNP
jgi:peptidoglycan/LPS O-acetylase OafA/YrhL